MTRSARLKRMKRFLSLSPYPKKDKHVAGHPDPLIVGHSSDVIGSSAHILGNSQHPDLRHGR